MTETRQRPFQVSEEEYPFADHWYERNGTAMHYVDEGEGIPIVMCHGNPTWSFLYRHIIKALRGEYRCIAYDLPGFGMSEHPPGYGYTPQEQAEWVEVFVNEHLKLDKFIIVCQDWGGPIGLTVATNNPDKVLGAVISSTWAWKTDMIGFIFSNLFGGPIGRYFILKNNIFAAKLVPAMMPNASPDVLKAYTDPFPTPESRVGTAVFPKEITAATPWLQQLEKKLHKLADKPIELIFGMKDIGSKQATINTWMSHFPTAMVTKVPDANHFTQEDCPEKYIEAIQRISKKINN